VARALSARRPAVAPEAPRWDPARRFLSNAVAKRKPSTSDRGVAPRCEAQWDALDRSRPSPCRVTVLPARRAHRLALFFGNPASPTIQRTGLRHADDSPAQGRRSLSLPKAVGALFIAVIGSARGRWFPRFFPPSPGRRLLRPQCEQSASLMPSRSRPGVGRASLPNQGTLCAADRDQPRAYSFFAYFA
jgi:hypothetical protein